MKALSFFSDVHPHVPALRLKKSVFVLSSWKFSASDNTIVWLTLQKIESRKNTWIPQQTEQQKHIHRGLLILLIIHLQSL